MTEAYIRGDKFKRQIEKMATTETVRASLVSRGWDGQLYTATRQSKQRGGQNKVFVAMVYRSAKTGEYVAAF